MIKMTNYIGATLVAHKHEIYGAIGVGATLTANLTTFDSWAKSIVCAIGIIIALLSLYNMWIKTKNEELKMRNEELLKVKVMLEIERLENGNKTI